MVARLTVGKKRYVDVEESMNAIIAAAADLRQRLIAAIDEDILAFSAVMDAYRLSKDDPERQDAIQSSIIGAADVPLNMARIALDVMLLVEQVAKQGNVNAASDAAVASLMGLAAIEGAALNVRVNVTNLDDDDLAARYTNDIAAIVDQARDLRDVIVATTEDRAGITSQV